MLLEEVIPFADVSYWIRAMFQLQGNTSFPLERAFHIHRTIYSPNIDLLASLPHSQMVALLSCLF